MSRRKIRVLQIVPALVGGPGHVVCDLLRNLDRAHYEATLCTMYEVSAGREIPLSPAQGIVRVCLEMKNFLEARAWSCLKQLVRSEHFDIVHTHLTRGDFYGRTVARWCRFPRVVSTIHNQDRFLYIRDFGAVRGRLIAAVNRLSMRLAEKLVAISEGVRSYLVEVEAVAPQKVAVVKNGIQLEQFDPLVEDAESTRQRLGISKQAFVIGTIAVLNPRKGLVNLIRAARAVVSKVSRAYFLLVGTGPQEIELRRLVATLDLESRVLFYGEATHPEVPSLVRAMDVFVLPSLIDGLGLAPLEAQALEKPCIITSIPGLNETVVPGETGLVVPPGDEAALAQAILSLLRDPERRRAMGKAGRRHIEEHYSASRMARGYEQVYEDVLGFK